MPSLLSTLKASCRAAPRNTLIGIYPATVFIASMQTIVLCFYRLFDAAQLPTDVGSVVTLILSYLPAIALVQLVNLLCCRSRAALVTTNCGLIVVYALLLLFHLDARSAPDYTLLRDNFGELFYKEAAGLLLGGWKGWALLSLGISVAILLLLEYSAQILSRWRRPENHRARIVASFALCSASFIAPQYVFDDLTDFLQSSYDYYFPNFADLEAAFFVEKGIDVAVDYPYLKPVDQHGEPLPRPEDLPHIFVLSVESFNANYARTRTPDGREYTPYFNSLAQRGVYIDRFYGNSVQTARGQVATLCSILPSMRGKVFTDYPSLNLHCLPEILKSRGYYTMFFSGFHDLSFDNTGESMKKLGFDVVKAMDQKLTQDVDRKFYWGWGFQDDILYGKVFDFLDQRERQLRSSGPGGPRRYFIFVPTISNHMPFNRIPQEQRYLYPHAKSYRDNYANSIFLTDHYLKEFFFNLEKRPYLKNSLVIIVGDHSFPIGEHGNYHNEVGAYDENFRTPMLMFWNEHLQPRMIKDRPYSQVDLAPTVLDLLKIGAENHFIGRSLFRDDGASDRPVHLVQPYDGTWLAVVRWPLKYVRHLRTKREFLYNLANDPMEKQNISNSYRRHGEEFTRLRNELSFILFNQTLIDSNRIWPPGAGHASQGQPKQHTGRSAGPGSRE